MALFVNETTLLPVLFPFAPSKTVIERFPIHLAVVLDALGVDAWFIDREIAQWRRHERH